MKISYNWLKQYLNINLEPQALSELLTDCGLEVEGLEKWQSIKGGLEGIVIGEVKSCSKHPNADKLSVTTVDVGQGNLLPIVCGAPNVASGQKVLVATVGARLYDGDDFFEIKKAKLRGEPSEGMICAEDELGLGTSHDGIMVLDKNANTGTPASDYFQIEDDYVFEIGLTPNRTDAMSHIGVARDIKAVLDSIDFQNNQKSKYSFSTPSIENFEIDNHDLDIKVIVEDTDACPRYAGLTIKDIKVGDSPDWLKNKLNAIGVRPINNIVDITNYVLHETGQPLHAFDSKEIKGNKVVVKKLLKDSLFVTLDEIERKLSGNDLMICNIEEGMCIGGVFGGIHSGVSEETTSLFLESACFDPVHVRKTSKYHDLQTDASFRFERGVDPNTTLYALKRAAILIKEIAGGTISSEIKDVYPTPIKKAIINIKWKNIDRLIGKSIGKDIIKNILESLEFKLLNETNNDLQLEVPLYRVDVTREADVIEEILRVYGYNNVEIPTQQLSSISHSIKPDRDKTQTIISDYLSGLGFTEIMNNSLTKSTYYEKARDFDVSNCVEMLNPLSRDLNVMRQSLLFGGLESILYNLNRKNESLKFFELGKTYCKINSNEESDKVTEKFKEETHLALFVTGRKEKESWYTEDQAVDFNYLKAISQNILKRLGINITELKFEQNDKKYLLENLAFTLNDKLILTVGNISKNTLQEFDIKQEVIYAELNWDLILKHLKKNKISYQEIQKFPKVRRDLALLLDQDVEFAEIEKMAYRVESKLLKNVNLFDIYEGKNIESGKKSYAVSFTLLDEQKTLTDKVIDKAMNKLMKAYKEQFNAEIR